MVDVIIAIILAVAAALIVLIGFGLYLEKKALESLDKD